MQILYGISIFASYMYLMMSLNELWHALMLGLQQTTLLEAVAVTAGIVSVYFSRRENILVYPTGLINTIIFIYLSLRGQLYGEASVNLYYTIMSIYGWWLWSQRNEQQEHAVRITFSSTRMWLWQLTFFAVCYGLLYGALSWLHQEFAPGAIPWADALASAAAYTGMWLMARKKVESWCWWMVTNMTSIPLYFVKGYVFTSLQFLVLLFMAIAGLLTWRKKALRPA